MTIVLLFALLGSVDGTKGNAEDITRNMTGITRETQKTSLATELNGVAKQIYAAVAPLEPSLATDRRLLADQLEGLHARACSASVLTIQRLSGTTLASVEASAAAADQIERTSDAIARYAAAIRSTAYVTAGKADVVRLEHLLHPGAVRLDRAPGADGRGRRRRDRRRT